MSTDLALTLSNQMIWTALTIAGPILGLSMLVGLLISVIQVVTQIQELSLTFVPKIFAVALALIALGSWMLNKLIVYAVTLYNNIPQYF